MARGRRPRTRNVIGQALAARRAELGLPRHALPQRYRLEQIEGTAKIRRASHLLRLEGSEELLAALSLSLGDLERLAGGELDLESVLVLARARAVEEAAGD